jgi:hypothetical protein
VAGSAATAPDGAMTPARSSIIKASQGRRVMFPGLGV